jgi:hypothetical protein
LAVSPSAGSSHNPRIDQDGAMRINLRTSKTPIRSRSECPQCGSPLFYIATLFTFLNGKRVRKCLAPRCTFVDPRRFKVTAHTAH